MSISESTTDVQFYLFNISFNKNMATSVDGQDATLCPGDSTSQAGHSSVASSRSVDLMLNGRSSFLRRQPS